MIENEPGDRHSFSIYAGNHLMRMADVISAVSFISDKTIGISVPEMKDPSTIELMKTMKRKFLLRSTLTGFTSGPSTTTVYRFRFTFGALHGLIPFPNLGTTGLTILQT